MIYRDVTSITADNNTCNAVSSDSVIYGYSNNNKTRHTYVLIEDKYVKTQTSTNNYGYDITPYRCFSTQELESLAAESNYYTPFYGVVALAISALVLGLVWFCIKSIFGRRV